jgi:hypothetical protein
VGHVIGDSIAGVRQRPLKFCITSRVNLGGTDGADPQWFDYT